MRRSIFPVAAGLTAALSMLGTGLCQELGIAGLGVLAFIVLIIGAPTVAFLAQGPGGMKAVIDAAFPRKDTD